MPDFNLHTQPTSNQLYHINSKFNRSFIRMVFTGWKGTDDNIRDKWQAFIRYLDSKGKLTKYVASDLISAHEERDTKRVREILKDLLKQK